VGGDGTFHEVVNGLAVDGGIRDDVLVGCLPAGTGMDFARNLPFPRRLGMVSDRIVRGFERRIDIGLARSEQSRFFVNSFETGLGAEVVARASLLSPRLPGRAAFLISAIGAALKESNLTATIALDGQKLYQGPLVSVVVANGRYFGGGMKIAPHAKMDDGELDVLVLGDFTRAEMISQIWKIYPGAHLNHHKVLWARGRLVEVYPESPTRLDLDGELGGRGPYTVSVLPQALRVIA
jgi:diacylglycerol kinase (ATP)